MNSRQHILQTRLQELQARRDRLTRKLQAVSQQRDDETRAEEKLRQDAIIQEIENDRRQVEAELFKLEDELNALNAVAAPPSLQPPRPKGVSGPIKLFYSYAHEDEALRERLEVHLKLLKRQGILQDWHDRDISAGSEWAKQISAHLESADLILLLISPDFIASNYCWDIELKRAMERHEAGEARVILIILRETDWTGAPFGKLQALPKDAKPVKSWPDQDAAFVDIARGIRKVAEEWAGRGRSSD
jgi:DNA repair exonuclease SbcCD ATPase subunit